MPWVSKSWGSIGWKWRLAFLQRDDIFERIVSAKNWVCLHCDATTFAKFAMFAPECFNFSRYVTDMGTGLVALSRNRTILAHVRLRADALSQGTETLAIAISETARFFTIRSNAIWWTEPHGAICTRIPFSAHAFPVHTKSIARACIWARPRFHKYLRLSLLAAVRELPSIVTDALAW